MRSRRARIMAAGGLGLAALGLAAVLVWPRGATPVTEDEALADFRADASSPGSAPEDSTRAPGIPGDGSVAAPEPGVYLAAASGREEVELGPLPTETRRYPETVPVVVIDEGDGCFTVTLELLDQHSEETTYCVTDGALRLDGHRKHQQVGPIDATAEMTCDPDLLARGAGPDQVTELGCNLEVSGGPAALSAEVSGTSGLGDPTTVEIAGEGCEARPMELRYEVTGDLRGTWRERIWFATDDRLPLRVERDLELEGLATFTEHSVLELTGTVPSR